MISFIGMKNPETRVFCQWFLGCVQVNPFSMKSDFFKKSGTVLDAENNNHSAIEDETMNSRDTAFRVKKFRVSEVSEILNSSIYL